MKQQPRISFTKTDKALMWDRWQARRDTGHCPADSGSHYSGSISCPLNFPRRFERSELQPSAQSIG